MYDVSCYLLSTSYQQDEIGNEIEVINKKLVPIIKVEDIYSTEYYEANQQGYKPNLRLRISTLNYENEEELEYMCQTYSIIRVQTLVDETILVCERKIKNVNKT